MQPEKSEPVAEKTPTNTDSTNEQTSLPSSIQPSGREVVVEEQAPLLDVADNPNRSHPKVDLPMDQSPKNHASAELAQDIAHPAIQSALSLDPPAEEEAPKSAPENTRFAYDALARPVPIEANIDMPDPVPTEVEHVDQQAPQLKVENGVAQHIFKPEEADQKPSLDESSKVEHAVETGLSYANSTPSVSETNTTAGGVPPTISAEAHQDESYSVSQQGLGLTSGPDTSSIPCPNGSLSTKEYISNAPTEEDDDVTLPSTKQYEHMDTGQEDTALSRSEIMLDLGSNPLALKMRRAIDPCTISSLETIPSPAPSDTEPSSIGLMSNEDIEHAFEQDTKADAKAADTPLTDIVMGEASISDSVTQPIPTAASALDTKLADEAPEKLEDTKAAASVTLPSKCINTSQQTPAKSTLKQIIGESRNSFASSSSLSALTDISGLSSKPPSVSSKATTPFDVGSPREPVSHFTPSSTFQVRSAATRLQFNVRPRVSIPADLTPQEYAMECIEAGENSRLNAYALHPEEYLMLRSHISHGQVTTYLNIRNGILRLWVRNPQIAVTREEGIGCAKDTRWFDVASVCFDWLVRRGYINYGCVEIRQSKSSVSQAQPRKRRTVVVIGAGFSGLGCARQLEGLFKQYSKRFREMGEEPPRVVVLEGRNRVGGRVYSRAFETLPTTAPGVMRGRRFTAEMGGMIITGFERGNPLNILVRGQLGLPYHCLLADMSLHDSNGSNVDLQRDTLVEQLYNACLERVSEYKFRTQPAKLIEGNHDLMDEGRDSSAEGHKTIALVEETTAAQPHAPPVSEQNIAPQVDLVPVSTNRMTGKVHTEPGTAGSTKAAYKAKQIGWTLKAGVSDAKDIDLDPAVNDSKSTLGSVLDNALMQHKEILDLNAQDFRLFNWHIANLEYSNATNLNRLSSRGWDVDVGNEWDGRHTMVVGGYQSVARGLAMLPAPLDIKHKAAVKRIEYTPDGPSGPAQITLEDGKTVDADYVVNTIPLGVLKHGSVDFQPPLPSWKTQAIERLGFGVLNKVILVYKEAFWDKDRDIFGMLQTPTNRSSLNQKDYGSRRGRFFQWFSVTNTTGMPCLLALMAGDAAYDTEITPNDELIAEATEVLRMRYGARVMQPLEAIVTRWESDRFARGSYSNAGVNMQPEDYQLMSRTIGNLYFAGEHTIVTHPATVHGAYLSGLRAASDVLDAMLGPIEIPTPLVLPRETSASLKRKAQEEHRDPALARFEAYEMEISEHILATIGPYPLKPAKVAGNPYIIFNKANYEIGRKKCEEGRRAGKGKPSPNEVRTMTSKMWKEAGPELRKPFEDAAEEQKRAFAKALSEWTAAAAKWESEAAALRERYVKEHPSIPGADELAGGNNEWGGARRAKRMVESYREADSDIDMD